MPVGLGIDKIVKEHQLGATLLKAEMNSLFNHNKNCLLLVIYT